MRRALVTAAFWCATLGAAPAGAQTAEPIDAPDATGAAGAAASASGALAGPLTAAELDRMITTLGRQETARRARLLGDRAVPALIEARGHPSAETRAWATALLESMGKRSPGDAVQTGDNQLLADVLRAYATIHDVDAVPVALSFVNSDRAVVRAAARDAVLAYGQDATRRLRETYAVVAGSAAPAGMPAADLARALFDAYDRARVQDVYARLEDGLAKQRSGRLTDAVADFDAVLARQPLLDRRAEMAPAYVALAESLPATERPQALAHLRRALRLDDAGPASRRARSDIACLEGEDLLARGVADTGPFEQALALDPGNPRAATRLDELRTRADASRAAARRIAVSGGVLAASLVAIAGILLGRRRSRRDAPG